MKTQLILLDGNVTFEDDSLPLFQITLSDHIIDLEDFSEHLCDWCNDYLEEQHQVILDEIPDSFINNK